MRGLLNFLSMKVMGYLKGAMKMKSVQKGLSDLEADFNPFVRLYEAKPSVGNTSTNSNTPPLEKSDDEVLLTIISAY